MNSNTVTPPPALPPLGSRRLSRACNALLLRGSVGSGAGIAVKLRKLAWRPFWFRHGIEFTGVTNWKEYPLLPHRRPFIENLGRMVFGRHVAFRCASRPTFLGTGRGATLQLGDHVFVNDGAQLCSHHDITVGNFTRIGMGARIDDTLFHPICPDEPEVRRAPIRLGWNTWIGQGAIIMPGVTVGDHSIVGAGSIVTRDIPARSVAVGSPARVIREFRCPDDWVRN